LEIFEMSEHGSFCGYDIGDWQGRLTRHPLGKMKMSMIGMDL
jgi:hypothetical protein